MIRHYWLLFKRKVLSYPIAYLSKYSLRCLLWTCKIEVTGTESFLETAAGKPSILMLWHNRLAIVAEVLYRLAPHVFYAALISKSRDGEPLALLAKSYKCARAIRVSHHAKHQSLKTLINDLKTKKEVVLLTPDGPKGPPEKVKPGIILASKESGAPVLLFTWYADKCWQLNTWDKFMIPRPFSKIQIHISSPLHLSESGDPALLGKQLEKEMSAMEEICQAKLETRKKLKP